MANLIVKPAEYNKKVLKNRVRNCDICYTQLFEFTVFDIINCVSHYIHIFVFRCFKETLFIVKKDK